MNPHYGGTTLRVEAHLLDFDGDLYGQRLVVELWERLRDERAFGSEAELVEAIAADVEAARARRQTMIDRAASARIRAGARPADRAHAAEVVVEAGPAADGSAVALE